MTDWKLEIVQTVVIKQQIDSLDKTNLFPYKFPNVSAKLSDIIETENEIGFKFDNDYANFLTHADGWNLFTSAELADLFGTRDYIGSERYLSALKTIHKLDDNNILRKYSLNLEDIFPICATPDDPVLYVMRKHHVSGKSRVFLFQDDLVDEYESFLEFFQSMRAYDQLTLDDLKNKYL